MICAVLNHGVREVMGNAAPFVPDEAIVVSIATGIELGTWKRTDQVLGDVLGPAHRDRMVILSGPSFAREITDGLPTAVTLASRPWLREWRARRSRSRIRSRAPTLRR